VSDAAGRLPRRDEVAAAPSGARSEQSGTVVAEIREPGLLLLVGVTRSDTAEGARAMAAKLYQLRILRDEESCATTGAPIIVVSQFTLYGRTDKGRRPSWSDAAPGAVAEPLINEFVAELRRLGARVETGVFGAHMAVASVNDGPFTVLLEG
jgi:D-tyrosyl-tRNA(Tyr) deacylase